MSGGVILGQPVEVWNRIFGKIQEINFCRVNKRFKQYGNYIRLVGIFCLFLFDVFILQYILLFVNSFLKIFLYFSFFFQTGESDQEL